MARSFVRSSSNLNLNLALRFCRGTGVQEIGKGKNPVEIVSEGVVRWRPQQTKESRGKREENRSLLCRRRDMKVWKALLNESLLDARDQVEFVLA